LEIEMALSSFTFTGISLDTGASSSDRITNATTLTLSGTMKGTGSDTARVWVSSDGGTSWSLIASPSFIGGTQNWSATLNATGGATYLVRVTNGNTTNPANGSVVTTFNSQPVVVDTSLPSAVATVTALSSDSGVVGDFITNVALQIVSGTYTGTLGSGESIQVSADGGTTWVTATAGAGSWSASGVSLSAAGVALQVRTIDTAGNITAGTGHGYTLDTTAPSAAPTITALSSDSGTPGDFITNVTNQTVSGSYSGTLGSDESIQVSGNGGTSWVTASLGAGSTWSASDVTLSASGTTLLVRTIDAAGNTRFGAGQNYLLDTTAPFATATVTTLSTDSGGNFITNVASQTVSGNYYNGTLASSESIQVSADGGANWVTATAGGGTWSASGVTLSASGTALQVRTIDAAGNITAGAGHTYTLDTIAPSAVATVTALSRGSEILGNFITNTTYQTVSGTYVGALGSDEKIEVSADGGLSWIPASAGSGTWSTTVGLLPGDGNTLQVRTIDAAGNTLAGTGHSYTLNALPTIVSVFDDVPLGIGVIGFAQSTNDTDLKVTVSLSGTGAVAGDQVQLYVGVEPRGSQIITAADIVAQSTSVQTGPLAESGYQFLTARLVDQAGNESDSSPFYPILEDPNAVCFAAGTRILTDRGEVAVELLGEGDIAMTLEDGSLAPHPIRWIGARRIDITAHRDPKAVAPMRVQAGAFGEGRPHTDLVLSPDHAVFVDGALIAVRLLINGTTIRQDLGCQAVTYYHVELDRHAVLLAEGLPAESYLDTGNRGFFANSGAPLVLHPDLTDEADYPERAAGSCAPFVWDEATVKPVWDRLARRAEELGRPVQPVAATTDPALSLLVTGRAVRPLYSQNGLHVFLLPRRTTEVRLVSRAGSPADVRPWLDDRRLLGVNVERIVMREGDEVNDVPVDHPLLIEGWWGVERSGTTLRRWTNGSALLRLPESCQAAILEIRICPGLQYIIEEASRAAA
jgi:hypothetical protein